MPSWPRYVSGSAEMSAVTSATKSGCVNATMRSMSSLLNASNTRRTISTFSNDISGSVSRTPSTGRERAARDVAATVAAADQPQQLQLAQLKQHVLEVLPDCRQLLR